MNIGGSLFQITDFIGYTVVPFVVVLGFMIFIHELGHFLAARAVGVRVLVFKLGFGRFLFKRTRGHTEYGIGWMPIGGYVRLFGDPTEAEGADKDTPLEEITEADKREALIYKPASQKLLVFFAGPLMNIMFAFLLAPAIFMLGVLEVPPVAGLIEPGSPAAAAGINPGDRILEIGGTRISSYNDLRMQEALNPDRTLTYAIDRKGQRLSLPVHLRTNSDPQMPLGESGITEPISSRIGALTAGYPAEAAGLKPGDTITEIDGKETSGWADLVDAVTNSNGKELTVVAARNGQTINVHVTPRFNKDADRYLIGIAPYQETRLHSYGPLESIAKGSAYCVNMVAETYVILWKLISLQLSPKVMSGPLGIGAITSRAAHAGFTALLGLTVLITINLGILNLLPFPPLDGGHIIFTALEGIIRREINMKYKEITFRVGFAILFLLMGLVTINDFLRYKTNMWDFLKAIGKGFGIG
ncbi:MAG TPA: RIP metalloprotease RseP [bacterium]|nr:RIP metalloprotease RseP [bacterium]